MAKRSWIFIRGLSRGQGHWADFLSIFAERFPNDEVECLDLPGNGSRFREASLLSTTEIARDLRARSRFIADGKKVYLMGHSLGGMVAVEWMKLYPEDIIHLVLVNTSAKNLGSPLARFNFRHLPRLPRLMTAADAFTHERITLSIIANNADRVKELLPKMASYTAAHPVRWSNTLRQLFAASRSVFPDQPTVPTTLIVGGKDRLVSCENSLNLGRRWKIDCRVHPWAGHDLAVDDPQWLVEQLL